MNFDKNNIKWFNNKYGLPECFYKIKVPSVSTILSTLPDPEYEKWIQEVGQEKVNEIMNLAAQRGTSMHFFF